MRRSGNGPREASYRAILDTIASLGRLLVAQPTMLDSRRPQRETGWQPVIRLEDRIRRTVDWMRARANG